MAFGFAGAGAGAADSLEKILAEQMIRAQLAQRQKEQADQVALQTQRLNQDAIEGDARIKQGQQQLDMQAGDRRERNNIRGIRRMLGESITQRTGPMTSDDRRGMAALQVEAGDDPTLLNEPKPERDPIADHEARLKLEQKYRPPQRPERDPIADHEAKLKLDAKYKTNNTGGLDPIKARETGVKMLETAKALRNDPNLGRLTGARIGNPDYALGVSQEPIAGSAAASVAPKFNTLKSLFTLENIGLLKGVLSDTDMKILASAGSSLETSMQDPAFVGELDRVIQKLESAFGNAKSAGLPPMDMATSRGTPTAGDPIDAMIAKYGGKPK